MKAIILAAGSGNRLGVLTEDKPKCMLEFGDETLIARQIRLLLGCGIKECDIILVEGHKHNNLYIDYDIKRIYNVEYECTDNSYSLLLALKYCQEDVLVLDGDLVFDKSVISSIIGNEGNILAGINKQTSYGMTGIAVNDGRINAIGKHIESNITYISIMKLCAKSIDTIKEELTSFNYKKTWYTIPLNTLLSKIEFHVKIVVGNICGINTYFDYLEAKRIFDIEDYSILVTGASGFLGKKIFYILKRYYNVIGIRKKISDDDFVAIDMVNKKTIAAYLELTRPSVVIHTAGIPEPEICELDREEAWKSNVETVRIITDLCKEKNIKLIYISTDYVFNGNGGDEYQHDSVRVPKNYYGETKLAGENIVKTYSNSLIVRIPIIYGYNDEMDKETFPRRLIRELSNGKKVMLDNKQIRYPVLIDDIAFAIKDALPKTGIIHISSSYPITKFSWAKIIANEFNLNQDLISEDLDSNLKDRPEHVRLNISINDYRVSDVQKGTSILKNQLRCVFKLIYKSNPLENLYGVNIGKYRYKLGKRLGKTLPTSIVNDIDCVVPIPNSGLYYAMGLADEIKKPYIQALIKPDFHLRSFQLADVALREQIIRDKILPIKELVTGKSIAIVDEAIFTGITLRIVCDILKACAAKKIYLCIPTPICQNSCKQYVQPERKLLSYEINENQAGNYFRVDGAFFMNYQGFMDSLTNLNDICFECFKQKAN